VSAPRGEFAPALDAIDLPASPRGTHRHGRDVERAMRRRRDGADAASWPLSPPAVAVAGARL